MTAQPLFDPAVIEMAADRGVTERPPIPGVRYFGFIVWPTPLGPFTLAIAHRHGEQRIVDLVRDNLSHAGIVARLCEYGIETDMAGDCNDGDDNLAHAIGGAIVMADWARNDS